MDRKTSLARRSVLAAAAGLAGAAALPATALGEPATRRGRPARADAALRTGAGLAEAETRAGRVAGYSLDGILAFKGVPYAADTGGAGRFQPPRPPLAWAGIRSCRHFGPIAPQDKGDGRLSDETAFLFRWNDSVAGEDCLRVNVWTPGADGRRRPVMVWLHGGGFTAGSGHDLPAFDGHNLARRGDVVVVTLNHRLNLLGFLDLSAHGERFAASANIGMLDIVAALEWVRDNIAAFGGDPGNVTIFGQSGGGAKVATLMGMPAARGLFHKAVVQSGSFLFAKSRAQASRLSELLLRELDLAGRAERLLDLPYPDLQRASDAVLRRENPPGDPTADIRRIATMLGYAPVVDGTALPRPPFAPDAPPESAGVPMLVGTTRNEFTHSLGRPELERLDEPGLRQRVEARYPGRAAAIVAAFRADLPAASPFDLWSRIATAPVRQAAIDQAAAKARQGRAPAFVYRFDREAPILDRRPRAFHCAEIPYVFHNAQLCASMTGGGPAAERLADAMADAWIAFARSGDPNHPGLPRWSPWSEARRPTMLFDDASRCVERVDDRELAALA